MRHSARPELTHGHGANTVASSTLGYSIRGLWSALKPITMEVFAHFSGRTLGFFEKKRWQNPAESPEGSWHWTTRSAFTPAASRACLRTHRRPARGDRTPPIWHRWN